MYHPWRVFKVAISEACWFWVWLKFRFQGIRIYGNNGEHAGGQIDATFEAETKVLRSLIRGTPWWVRGFVLLGERELALIQRKGRKSHPREIHSLEMCAKGAMELLEKDGSLAGNKVQLRFSRAQYLLGMSYFLKGDFAQAVTMFDPVLRRAETQLAAPKFIAQVQEYAGSACLALARTEEAKRYLKCIPSRYRSAEVIEVMNYLDKL